MSQCKMDAGGNRTHQPVAVPMYVDNSLAVSHVVCAFIGLPINLLIAAFIVGRRRLHQPRNILWLGIIASNLFILFAQMVELYTYFFQSYAGCRIRNWLVGLPYVTLLMNQLLSLIDRYVCISHNIWYRQSVTTRRVLIGQVGCFTLLCLSMKSPYIFGFIPLECRANLLDRKVFFAFILTFFILCVTGQVVLYLKTKTYLAIGVAGDVKDGDIPNPQIRLSEISMSVIQSRRSIMDSTAQPNVNCPAQPGDNREDHLEDEEKRLSTIKTSRQRQTKHHFVRIGNQTISRLELEATRNVTIGVTSLCIFALPWLISSGLVLVCMEGKNSENAISTSTCNSFRWSASYTRELMVVHSLYHSIFYVVRSRDFSAALGREIP